MGSGDYSGDALWVARTKKALGVDQALLLSKLRFLVGGSGQQAARDRSSGAAIANGPRISDVALQGEDSSFWPASDHKIDQDSSSKLNSPFWAARGKKSTRAKQQIHNLSRTLARRKSKDPLDQRKFDSHIDYISYLISIFRINE